MKILYCDCFSGISGDMLLGALIDAGCPEELLRKELEKLGISEEYKLHISKTTKNGIAATDVHVELLEHEHTHHHDGHFHKHRHIHQRTLADIVKIIDNSHLDKELKVNCKYIFQRLAQAEAKVHGTTIDKIHFHEVGAVDAIIDICGTVIALSLLGIKKIVSAPLPLGSGFVECAHGIIPLPAPATAELIKNVPVYDTGIIGELVTPTGAAIITSLADSFDKMPALSISSIGYGAGKKDYGIPNVLRVFIGEIAKEQQRTTKEDIFVLETTIDDITPEILGHLWEKIFSSGALDMYFTPVYMKKGRPAQMLTILAPEDKANDIVNFVFKETSTIGIRMRKESRLCLPRKTETIKTSFGDVCIKISGNNIKPEFEDMKKISNETNIPLKELYLKILAEIEKNNFRDDK